MGKHDTYVIVGGVAGGATAAARLRRLDEFADIIMFEQGEYISFANCGLPYYIGGEIKKKSALNLQTPKSFGARYRVDARINSRVVSIDRVMKTVTVKNVKTGETYKQEYDKLILSPGAKPIVPMEEGMELERMFTLRTIPDAAAIKDFIEDYYPQTAVIIGGGFVGVEMAENLINLGIRVTLVEMTNQVIGPIDYDMASEVHRYMEQKGIALLHETRVMSVREKGRGLEVVMDKDTIDADFVVNAIGVRPESGLAKVAGLQVNKMGAIVVSDTMQTSDPDIYAVGDAVQVRDAVTGNNGYVPLAGPANKQGRIAADNVCGINSKYEGTTGSAVIKLFDMTIASTGLNEKNAKKLDIDYEKTFIYPQSHAGYYPGAVSMSVKALFERKTGRILGAQIVGYEGVDKRADVLATAIRLGAKASDLVKLDLCYAPPYSSAKDPVNMVGYVIENLLSGRYMEYHWHDVDRIPRDGSVQLVDVRTELEYSNGHIDGYVNIPLDGLRGRLGELDRDKKLCITCQSGLRGYVAARILMQNGFDVYNLSGGYRLYKSIVGERRREAEESSQAAGAMDRQDGKMPPSDDVLEVDASGLQCPGPIIKLSEALKSAPDGQMIEVIATDPAFETDLEGFSRTTGLKIENISNQKGTIYAMVRKGGTAVRPRGPGGNSKNMIIFSGDLDKAIASFVIANAAAAMGRQVSMFFTFWGLSIIRKPKKMNLKKTFKEKMFGNMLPRGSAKLKLSQKNMGGMGADMIRKVMDEKNIDSLEVLIRKARENGVELLACSMSMDVMGVRQEELLDGVKLAGASTMLANAEDSDMSLFI